MIQKELDEIIKNHQHFLNQDCKDWESMRADLSEVDLRGLDFLNVDLSFANFKGANLENSNLIFNEF